jgi:hypothetical protein
MRVDLEIVSTRDRFEVIYMLKNYLTRFLVLRDKFETARSWVHSIALNSLEGQIRHTCLPHAPCVRIIHQDPLESEAYPDSQWQTLDCVPDPADCLDPKKSKDPRLFLL